MFVLVFGLRFAPKGSRFRRVRFHSLEVAVRTADAWRHGGEMRREVLRMVAVLYGGSLKSAVWSTSEDVWWSLEKWEVVARSFKSGWRALRTGHPRESSE